MISRRTTNLIIFAVSVIITLLVLALFIYLAISPEVEDRKNLLIGTGIGVISGAGLSLYIWSNRNELHH